MFKISKISNSYFAVLCMAILLALPTAAQAQNAANVDIIPASSMPESTPYEDVDSATHPPVRLTPDKSELIRLDQKAGTIIIGNPNHISVLAESAQTLVLVPRVPGATHVTVLDHQGNLIMQRHVIVASPKEKYVRIRRSCAAAGDGDCLQTQVYYCPDMCHEIVMSAGDDAGADNMEALAAAGQNAGEVAEAGAEAVEGENVE